MQRNKIYGFRYKQDVCQCLMTVGKIENVTVNFFLLVKKTCTEATRSCRHHMIRKQERCYHVSKSVCLLYVVNLNKMCWNNRVSFKYRQQTFCLAFYS